MPINQSPKVSVIIPSFNRADLLPETVESVLTQSFTDREIIVVDDGSTDSTREILETLIRADRVRYVRQTNQGESAARNHGLRIARGAYILFLDSDDLLLPQALEKLAASLDACSEVGLVQGGYIKFDNRGNDLGYRDTSRFSGQMYPRILLEWSVLMAVPTVMVRKSVLDEVGGFDETMRQAPDLDMWRRIAERFQFRALPEALAKIRSHEGNLSKDKTRAAPAFEAYLRKAFEDDPNLNPIYRRQAIAGMYANVGNTMLGEGEPAHMLLVRRYCIRSLLAWPFQVRAFLGLFGSFFGPRLRGRMLTMWRRLKYPRGAQ